MSTEQAVRLLATALPEVAERSMHEGPDVLVCRAVTRGRRVVLLCDAPQRFFTTDHYTGHASVLVRLRNAEPT